MAKEGLNKVILIGNLGQDPELKYTQGGQAYLKMNLATTESYKGASGERKEVTEWHTIMLWGKRAEALGRFLTKGRTLCVEGSIQYKTWESPEGVKKYFTEIRARNIVLLGGGERDADKRSGGNYDRPQGNNGQRNQSRGAFQDGDFPADDFGDDEIPF